VLLRWGVIRWRTYGVGGLSLSALDISYGQDLPSQCRKVEIPCLQLYSFTDVQMCEVSGQLRSQLCGELAVGTHYNIEQCLKNDKNPSLSLTLDPTGSIIRTASR
jgi:hypothetical protein